MCFPVSAILLLIVGVYVRLLIRFFSSLSLSLSLFLSLSLSEGFYSAKIIETDCTCIRTSLDPPLALSLSVFVSASGYIIGNLHVYEQM